MSDPEQEGAVEEGRSSEKEPAKVPARPKSRFARLVRELVWVVGLTVLLALVFELYNTTTSNQALRQQVAQRDSLIRKIQANDSLSCLTTNLYEATVTKYITTDCSLLVDGKKVSLERFIAIYSAQEDQRAKLQQDLDEFQRTLGALQQVLRKQDQACAAARDSLGFYRQQLQALRSTYKVQVHTRMQGSTRLMYAQTPQLDSALALLAMFRHELRYDSAKHQWKVRYPAPRAGR